MALWVFPYFATFHPTGTIELEQQYPVGLTAPKQLKPYCLEHENEYLLQTCQFLIKEMNHHCTEDKT